MTRPLPAHVVAAAAVGGLAFSDAARLTVEPSGVVIAVLAAASLAAVVPQPARLVLAAAVVGVAGWAWGSARLAVLDRSPLRTHTAESNWFQVTITSEPRVGQFGQRLFGRARRFGDEALNERVELELPLGRAPPQGARIRALAVVKLPQAARPGGGFDERQWLRRQGVHVVLHVDGCLTTLKRK